MEEIQQRVRGKRLSLSLSSLLVGMQASIGVRPLAQCHRNKGICTAICRSARVSWSDYSSRHATEEGWQQVDFRSLTSPQADDERRLLFAPDDCLTSNTR